MKKTIIVLTAIAITSLVIGKLYIIAADMLASQTVIRGSGNLVTRTVEVGPFDGIAASSVAKITVVKGSGPLTIQVDDNLLEFVVAKVEKGMLRIGFEKGVHNSLPQTGIYKEATLNVNVPSDGRLSDLKASNASTIVVEPAIVADELEIQSSGASKIVAMIDCRKAEIDVSGGSNAEIGGQAVQCETEVSGASHLKLIVQAGYCDLEASGASRIDATGSATECSLDASGSSQINASEFTAATCDASASGASKISVACTRSLEASASGASRITYTDNSRNGLITNFSKSGASSISAR